MNYSLRCRREVVSLCTLLFGLLVVSGCGGGVEVAGTVKAKGKPVPTATVTFATNDDKTVFVGVTKEDGTFVVDARGKGGLPEGDYKVTILWWTKSETPDDFLGGDTKSVAARTTAGSVRWTAIFENQKVGQGATYDIDVSKATKLLKFVTPEPKK